VSTRNEVILGETRVEGEMFVLIVKGASRIQPGSERLHCHSNPAWKTAHIVNPLWRGISMRNTKIQESVISCKRGRHPKRLHSAMQNAACRSITSLSTKPPQPVNSQTGFLVMNLKRHFSRSPGY